MSTQSATPKCKSATLPFYTVRNISCPEDVENNRKVYVGYTPVAAIVGLPTDENVRDYLQDAEGRRRRRPTQVHKAIQDTLENNPYNFSVLNSGVVIVARECEIDEKNKVLVLKRPSIINGSQTQGVIRDYHAKLTAKDEAQQMGAHVKFEVIVTDNEDLIAEVSIARNFQNDVMTISIAGRLGQLDELEKRLQKSNPNLMLQKSETKLSDDYIKTERLLQVITALIPESLWPNSKDFNKVYAYSMKAKCLKEFQELYKAAKDTDCPEHAHAKQLYEFYLDVAAQALELYTKWKCHPGFRGTLLRSIVRDEAGNIQEVPDGIVFPILSALSAFAKKHNGTWVIDPPPLFADEELIRAAKGVYMDIANSNPWNMGKSKSCYTALYQITSIYRKLSRSVSK
ncbi:MAG: AIPR family protein [Armatimonadota bacterium]|nr:AIPR family protein [bacterium]